MTDPRLKSSEQPLVSTEPADAPSLWAALAPLGTAICAGAAAYESFHMRGAMWWALGAGMFMLIDFLTHTHGNRRKELATGSGSEGRALPVWAAVTLVFMLILASVLLVSFNPLQGLIVLLMAVVFYRYGHFGVAEQIRMSPRRRFLGFVASGWVVLFMSIASQFFYPAFVDLFSVFGSDLPLLTGLVMERHRWLLVLPVLWVFVWAFWPVKAARLRAAMWFGWFSVVLMLLAAATLYLPIIQMGMVVG